jgi:archaellum component FlaF (FlaF/FlaG flagellin family)
MPRIIALLKAACFGWAPLSSFRQRFLLILAAFVVTAATSSTVVYIDWFKQEKKDAQAPVDYGYGPGKGKGVKRPNLRLGKTPPKPKSAAASQPNAATSVNRTQAAAVPVGGGATGYYSPPLDWPLIPLHVALLPDGRVMSFGTDEQGNQTAQFVYDIWDPTIGTSATNAHNVLPNTTPTDIFCSAQTLLDNGKLLITGGDVTVSGQRNYSSPDINIFNPSTNTLTAAGQMAYARWYPSITTLPNSDKLVLGGTVTPNVGEPTPELFSSATGWKTLPGISIPTDEWYYPRSFVGADGGVYVILQNGKVMRISTDGTGVMQDTGASLNSGYNFYPTTMFLGANGNPFSVLAVRWNRDTQIVDISQNPPVVSWTSSITYDRRDGNLTVLPDGKILASGGSSGETSLANAVYQSEIYDPATGTWTLDATAAMPRLYHSTTLLLQDGSVLSAGGGAPGPVKNLNAEIYYPPYLYLKDGSGNPAPRPTVSSPPPSIIAGRSFSLTVGASDTISKINLIRVGVNTHTFNSDQRLIPVQFTQSGTTITATVNATTKLMPSGYYMLFAFNSSGVPAVAPIIYVEPQPDLVPTSLSYDSTTGLFTVTVKNQGAAAVPSSAVIGNAFYVGGTFVTWGAVPGPLAPGASVSITSSGGGAYTIPPGPHTISVAVDDVNRIPESNESNNGLSQTITIGAGDLPDLLPTSLSYDSTTGLFTVSVKNQGTAAVPSNAVIGNAFSVDGTYVSWGAVPGPLAPGASVSITSSGGGAYTIPPGPHTISVAVDDVNRIPESNEGNNGLSQAISAALH